MKLSTPTILTALLLLVPSTAAQHLRRTNGRQTMVQHAAVATPSRALADDKAIDEKIANMGSNIERKMTTSSPDTLGKGMRLFADPSKGSTSISNGSAMLGLDMDGKFFIDAGTGCGKTILADAGSSNSNLVMQNDGNLVLYNLDDGSVIFDSGTAKNHGAILVLMDDGTASIKATNGNILKTFSADDDSCNAEGCVGDKLEEHMILERGEFICFGNMKFGLTEDGMWIYDNDGDVTEYGSIDGDLYGDIRMQRDGNLVLYQVMDNKSMPLCSTQTVGSGGMKLRITESGPEIVDGDNVVWSTSSNPAVVCTAGNNNDNDNDNDMKDMATFKITLTPGNEIMPFMGIPFAFGTAVVKIESEQACIKTDIECFNPGAIHIHFGPINENGDILVDFSPLIEPMEPDTEGCVMISKDLSNRILERPDLYYVNVHLGVSLDDPLILQAIRGQLVQGFTAELENEQTVDPFDNVVEGASGVATVKFEEAGTVACFDVTIDAFDPNLGHIHMAMVGMNGPRIFNYSAVKVAAGRFFGCQDITDDDIEGSVEDVKALLADPSMFYFDYHPNANQPDVFTSIRGQLPGH